MLLYDSTARRKKNIQRVQYYEIFLFVSLASPVLEVFFLFALFVESAQPESV
jgi:hypothetical protein